MIKNKMLYIAVVCLIGSIFLSACNKDKSIDETQAKEIVFAQLQNIKEETLNTTVEEFFGLGYSYVGDLGGGVLIHQPLPAFEMKMTSIDDVEFVEAEINETDNAWIIDAIVKTTWGDIYPGGNFEWSFFVDLDTGQLQRKPMVSEGSEMRS
jgi:hypothetical protein